jgi:hypothetical protein
MNDMLDSMRKKGETSPVHRVAHHMLLILEDLIGDPSQGIPCDMSVSPAKFAVHPYGEQKTSNHGLLYVPCREVGGFIPILFEDPNIRGGSEYLVAFGDFSVGALKDKKAWEFAKVLASSAGKFYEERDWAPIQSLLLSAEIID